MTGIIRLSRPMALVTALLLAFSLISCDPKEKVNPEMTLSKTGLSFTEAGGMESVSVKAGGAWNATVDGTWVTLSSMGGTSAGEQMVVVTAEPNTGSPKQRTASVVFKSGNLSATLSVTQSGADIDDPSLPDKILDVNFKTSKGSFTIEDKTLPSQLTYVWIQDATYGMKASARKDNVDYAAESWLISPEIDLTNRRSAYLSFSHVARFYSDKPSSQLHLKVTTDNGKSWKDVDVPNWSNGSDWVFVNSGDIDLSSFCKNRIKIAFQYTSSSSASPTWEIQSLSLTRDPGALSDVGQSYKGVPSWLELPKVNDGDKFLIHAVSQSGKKLRNYSLVFDTKTLVAPWVAYPLCDAYTRKTVQRSDAWGMDPFLASSEQPILAKSGDFFANGYERGHQIASADRLASTDLNTQTFYYTNMAPMHKAEGFNGGVWATLEDKVRTWSSSKVGTDTLYVVTGAVTKGSTKTVNDNSGKTVTVPAAFYKALLRYSKTEGYCAVGFYLDHKIYSSSVLPKESVCSIDALEEKLGIDFFPNLESVIGKDAAAKVEAMDPLSVGNKFWEIDKLVK